MQEQIREFVCELSYIVLDNETAAFNLLNIYVYAWKKIQYIKYTEIHNIQFYTEILGCMHSYKWACSVFKNYQSIEQSIFYT